MTPSKALFCFCVAFIAGIGLSSFVKIPQFFLWGFLFIGVLLVVTKLKSINICIIRASFVNWHRLLGFCILFFVLGVTRLQIAEFNIENDPLKKLNGSSGKIALEGQIISEPDIRDSYQKLKVRISDTKSAILVTTGRHPEYQYLDKVRIAGELKTPPAFPARSATGIAGGEDFNYKNFLLKDGIYSVIDFPRIELISNKHDYNIFTFFYEKILFSKKKLAESISLNFSSPQNFILNGIILGNDKNWPKDLKDKFNVAGLSHITAVSGSNIIILINVLVIVLLSVGLWRGQALCFSIVLVWMYIAIVGFPASGVRAAIMGSIFLLAQIFGRQNTSSRTILLAGALMLFQNPFLLLYDVGFQLSFLASMGITHIKPIIDSLLESIKGSTANYKALQFIVPAFDSEKPKTKIIFKTLKSLVDIVSITLAVQILTLPIVIYNFGAVSLVALLTNLLILPIIPFLTIFGFLAGVSGIFSGFLGWVSALPCYVMLFYFLKVLNFFYQPWAVKNFGNISWIWVLAYYVVFLILIWFLQKKIKPKFLGC